MARLHDYPHLLRAFEAKLKECTRTSRFHDPHVDFVLENRLLDWLREPLGDGTLSRAYALLEYVYEDREPYPGVFMELERSKERDDRRCWLKVFVILLQMSDGGMFARYIHMFFYDSQVWDSTLPDLSRNRVLGVIRRTRHFPADQLDTATDDFLFFAQQLSTQEAITMDHQRDLNPRHILPIIAKEPVNKGGQGNVFRIEVPLECLSDDFAEVLGEAEVDNCDQQSRYYTLALKKIAYEDDWRREIVFHRALQNTEGIVQCLGSWRVQTSKGPEFYLLLEYGWSDLGQYFGSTPAPSLPEEIFDFWRSFLSIATALSRIHNLTITGGGRPINYYGWHGDIKLSNILLCGNVLQGNKIKLTDPGYAIIERRDEVKRDEELRPVVTLLGGTTDYGGPERVDPRTGQLDHTLPVTQLFDVWSFACILYEAATWVILGPRGIEQFKLVRKMKNGDADSTERPHGNEAFHNKGRLSSAVCDWHNFLLRSVRSGDFISERILTIAQDDLLLEDPHKRVSSADLVRRVEIAFQDCEKEMRRLPNYVFPAYFDTAFDWEADKAARDWQNGSTSFRSMADFRSVRFAQHRGPLGEGDGNQGLSPLRPFPRMSGEQAPIPVETTMGTDPSPAEKETSEANEAAPIFGYYNAVELLTQRGWTYTNTFISPSPRPGRPTSEISRPSEPSRDMNTRASTSTWSKFSRKMTGMTTRGPDERTPTIQYGSALSHAWHRFKAQKNTQKYSQPLQTNDDYGELFKGRDIIFLVDNNSKMNIHWSQVQDILSLLMAMLHGQDDDGSDLYFSSAPNFSHSGLHEPHQVQDILRSHRPSEKNEIPKGRPYPARNPGTPDTESREGIHIALDDILHKVKNKKPYEGKVTIIILTNAIWSEAQQSAVTSEVVSALRFVSASDTGIQLQNRDLSIQFILFGDDENGRNILEYMDDELPKEYKLPDVIDYEPASGNIMKMIMGSLDDIWDNKESAQVEKTTADSGLSPGLSEDRQRGLITPITSSDSLNSQYLPPGGSQYPPPGGPQYPPPGGPQYPPLGGRASTGLSSPRLIQRMSSLSIGPTRRQSQVRQQQRNPYPSP